jgi:hypothetical protein
MNSNRIVLAAGAAVLLAAALLLLLLPPWDDVAPADDPVAGTLRWRSGHAQRHRIALDCTVTFGGDAAAHGPPVQQVVHGELAVQTLTVAADAVVLGLRLDPLEVRTNGQRSADDERLLGTPFRLRLRPDGAMLGAEFPAGVPATHAALLEELVRTFQVTVQAGSQWTSRETHATGRYRADYRRDGAERLLRSKRGYEAGPADEPTRAIAVPSSTAEITFGPDADWLAGMRIDETLATRDSSGLAFRSHTRAELQILPARAVEAAVADQFDFVASAPSPAGTAEAIARQAEVTPDELAAAIAALLGELDRASEGRTTWVHRLRDLLRADDRAAALLLAALHAGTFAERTRADVFLALELGGTDVAQQALAEVAAAGAWSKVDRLRAVIALGGVERPSAATLDALWQATQRRQDATGQELADTALLALGALGSSLPHDATYTNLCDGLRAIAYGGADVGERSCALAAIANTGDAALARDVQPLLDAQEPAVRRAAAKAYGTLLPSAAAAEFAARLGRERASTVRAAMAASLRSLPSPEPSVLAAVRTQLLQEVDASARLDLARCLGRHLDDPTCEAALRAVLARETLPQLRREIGEMLARLDTARAHTARQR